LRRASTARISASAAAALETGRRAAATTIPATVITPLLLAELVELRLGQTDGLRSGFRMLIQNF
jgi:hypothetical protein